MHGIAKVGLVTTAMAGAGYALGHLGSTSETARGQFTGGAIDRHDAYGIIGGTVVGGFLGAGAGTGVATLVEIEALHNPKVTPLPTGRTIAAGALITATAGAALALGAGLND